MKKESLSYGPVVIKEWFDEDRIGFYDDDTEDDEDTPCAVVFLGNMFLTLSIGHYLIPYSFLRPVTTDDLWKRREKIHSEIGVPLFGVPPVLLQTKKYADFRNDYADGLETLLASLLPRPQKSRLKPRPKRVSHKRRVRKSKTSSAS